MTLSTKEAATTKVHEEPSSNIEKLALFFGLAYSAGSVGQSGGLISWPVSYFFKETVGLDAAQVTQYLAILALPWAIKPIFGLLTDLVPFCGYRLTLPPKIVPSQVDESGKLEQALSWEAKYGSQKIHDRSNIYNAQRA